MFQAKQELYPLLDHGAARLVTSENHLGLELVPVLPYSNVPEQTFAMSSSLRN